MPESKPSRISEQVQWLIAFWFWPKQFKNKNEVVEMFATWSCGFGFKIFFLSDENNQIDMHGRIVNTTNDLLADDDEQVEFQFKQANFKIFFLFLNFENEIQNLLLWSSKWFFFMPMFVGFMLSNNHFYSFVIFSILCWFCFLDIFYLLPTWTAAMLENRWN